MISSQSRVVLAFGSAVLLVAIALVLLPTKTAFFYRLNQPLANFLPSPLPGWTCEDIPIASTPEVAEAVEELLNFSEGLYRIYRAGDREIKVYVAYWVPGKMDPRLVGVHSPDVCWVGAGWKRIGDMRRRSLSGERQGVLSNGHERTFEINGQREDVVFWHFIGGHPSRYLEPGKNGWTLAEILRNPFAPRYEQFFVRISTSGALDEVAAEPMMQSVVQSVSVVAKY